MLGRPVLLGVSGAQGTGKSFLAARIAAARLGRIAALSLDDFYLTADERAALAARIHPLFAVRGPPGTHDLDLLNAVLNRLAAADAASRTALPVFDKLADERAPQTAWPVFAGRPDAVVIDGWCLGAEPAAPDALAHPVNALEREEDADGVWRRTVYSALAGPYRDFFGRLDAVVFLKAPSFAQAAAWRLEAERAAYARIGQDPPAGLKARMARFTDHYERITLAMLAGARRAELVVTLDEARGVLAVEGALPGEG